MKCERIRQTAITLFCGAVLGYFAATLNAPTPLSAQDRDRNQDKTPLAFLSGSERSLSILSKISKQLETLDGRVENIESAVAGANKKK